jgi:thiosulfate/3-mercaptopyruvate sulfurtransferase
VTIALRALAATLALLLPAVAAATPSANLGLLVETDELAPRLGAPGVLIVDLRGDAGRGEAAHRAGHDPDQTVESADALREIFEAAGVRPDRRIVTYCPSGSRSAHDDLALRLLGYARIENYDGSWNEWANDPVLPVAR